MKLIALITIQIRGKEGEKSIPPGEEFSIADSEGEGLLKRGFAILPNRQQDASAGQPELGASGPAINS